MISVLLSRLVLLIFGTLYPAYASYKTVKTKNVRDYVKWMMYWIVFAVYTLVEIFADIFLSFWFPFYYEIKILFVFWLICPATRGSTYLFRKVINPQLSKHELLIDSYIDSMWDHGYDIARKIGAQGVDYLAHLLLELLRKGQLTAALFLPKLNEVAQTNDTIQSSERKHLEGNISDENALNDEDFDILVAENPELYKAVKAASSAEQTDSDYQDVSDSYFDEDVGSVKYSPVKLVSKNKRKAMGLRERKKKTTK